MLFTRTSRALFIGIILLLNMTMMLQGCVTIESVKDPNFTDKVDRMYIFIRGADDSHSYFERLCDALSDDLSLYGVEVDFFIYDELELIGETELEMEIASFAPDVTMTILQTEQSYVNGAKSGGKFTLSLFEPYSDKPVWKAQLKTSTSGYAGLGPAKDVSRKIVTQLKDDRVI